MARLRRSRPSSPGLARRRAGRGWVFLDEEGARVSDATVIARCKDLVIPPAWTDVWICPWPNGHLQAMGTDEAGRRQYLYHPAWRVARDREKHQRVLETAHALPAAREAVGHDLTLADMSRRHVLAVAFRLLDIGLFRVGGETYALDNGSYGLATLRRDHVTVGAKGIEFDYVAKSGKQRTLVLRDEACAEAISTLKRRGDDDPELLAWRESTSPATWRDITSSDINEYVQEVVGGHMSAKDFRTWHGTVLAATALAELPAAADLSATKRTREVASVMRRVSEVLGNTPAVARASYVDPRLVDLWEDGYSIAPALADDEVEDLREAYDNQRDACERATLALLTTAPLRINAALRRVKGRTKRRR
nr:DNA topoisomerase IB [Demequina aurantiaca]